MKLNPIINSLLENDAYKFSMGAAFFHQHQNKQARWAFKCRNKDVKFSHEFHLVIMFYMFTDIIYYITAK